MAARSVLPTEAGQPEALKGQASHRPCLPLRAGILAALILLLPMALSGQLPAWFAAGAESPLALISVSIVYALLLAIPFIPSVEIGLLIMMIFGKWGAVGAWVATLIGLNLAYFLGRHFCRDGAKQVPALLAFAGRLQAPGLRLPAGGVPIVTLAGLLNMPGNTAIGGGGGIAMVYGATRLLGWPAFAITTAAATALLPLLFLLGIVGAEQLVAQ